MGLGEDSLMVAPGLRKLHFKHGLTVWEGKRVMSTVVSSGDLVAGVTLSADVSTNIC